MIAVLYDNQWINFEHITDPEENILWKEFSVSRPNAYVNPDVLGTWDGVFRKYNRAKKRIARPLLGMLRSICKKHGLPLTIQDKRPKWGYKAASPEDITPDFLPGITLESYQIKAIQQCCKTECGILDYPTGGGKGEIICGICKAIPCPTLILADQRVVVDQLKKRLELRDVAGGDIGLFYAGKRPSGELVIVGLIQSLNMPKKPPDLPTRKADETDKVYAKRLKKWDEKFKAYQTRIKNVKFLNAYIKKAEMIIVDECDKAVSESFKHLFRFLYKGRRRYGLSGTPTDHEKPVEAVVMQEHLGSIICREDRSVVLAKGRIVPCYYKMLAFGLDGNINESSAYDIAYTDWLIANKQFHNTIKALCQKYIESKVLILVDRQDLGKALEEILNNSGIESHFIYGKTPKRRRNETLKRFETGEFKVLIGGKIINRGLDLIGGCDNLIIAGAGKSSSDIIQKIGRAVRLNSQGFSRVFDFFFRCNRYLYDHSKRRLKAIVGAGFDAKVVFPGGIVDGREFVERGFRVGRKLLG